MLEEIHGRFVQELSSVENLAEKIFVQQGSRWSERFMPIDVVVGKEASSFHKRMRGEKTPPQTTVFLLLCDGQETGVYPTICRIAKKTGLNRNPQFLKTETENEILALRFR